MTGRPAGLRRYLVFYTLAYVLLAVVALRELPGRAGTATFLPCILLLAAFALLTATDPLLFGRFRRYPYAYFPAVTVLILALGWLPPYRDIWSLLFVLIGLQASHYLPPRVALSWAGVSTVLALATLIITLGLWPGLGDGLTILAAAILVVSWDALSTQARTAREASQALLAELQQAHARLQAFADDVEQQAALRERDRMAHRLHDSVSQTLFSIALAAESARLLLAKDPSRLPAQLERLEALTAGALAEMRSLITEWRPT